MTKTLNIINIGNVREFTFDMPDGEGGVCVLRGPNAAGKSTVLLALEGIINRHSRLKVTDHAERGSAEFDGARVSVTSQNRHTGEIESETLGGRFSIASLIDTPFKDSSAADAHRIKVLHGLSGTKVEPDIFYELAGGQETFEMIVSEKTRQSGDPLEIAQKLHKGLHGRARDEERSASHEEGHAQSCEESAEGVDVTAEHRSTPLQLALTEAVTDKTRLWNQAQAAERAKQQAADATSARQEAEANYSGPSPANALAKSKGGRERLAECDNAVAEARKATAVAEANLGAAEREMEQLDDAHDVADNHAHAMDIWQGTIEAAADVESPTDDQIDSATVYVESATADVERGIEIRKAIESNQRAAEHKATAETHRKAAAQLREAAKSVDDVLSKTIPEGPLRYEVGRLVLDTERGKGVPYSECSQGERCRISLGYVTRNLGEGGVHAVEQSFWQDLDYPSRCEFADLCAELKIWIVTAEVSSRPGDPKELTAAKFEPETEVVA